ncbi:MAG: peptide deformylase [Oscillospiraceae bacterium]|nr:peptide deformylase [Candidatus Limimonas egerieequi]
MVCDICKDQFLLKQVCREAMVSEDTELANDLLDTLIAHADECVGMGANMIGKPVRIIAFLNQETDKYEVMFNPEIVKQEQKYETEEGCLSLVGKRPATRYKKIKVKYQDFKGVWKFKTYQDFTAQIIQHEIDHTNGILI